MELISHERISKLYKKIGIDQYQKNVVNTNLNLGTLSNQLSTKLNTNINNTKLISKGSINR